MAGRPGFRSLEDARLREGLIQRAGTARDAWARSA